MRVLFDLVHPADVHFFKNAILVLIARGDQVLITSRIKDITIDLLDILKISHQPISRKGQGPIGLFWELLQRDWAMWTIARKFRPDIFVSNNSPSASHIARIMGKQSIVFDDTEIHNYNRRLYLPVVTEVHSPDCYRLHLGNKHCLFPSYSPLSYLHPDHFTADPDLIRRLGFDPSDKMVLFRFVEWGAMHDLGLERISNEYKIRLVDKVLRNDARVLVSAEGSLPSVLEPYRLKIPLQHIHHLLSFVDLIVGESATICSEGACLGKPSVYIDEKGRGYTDEQENRYGLVSNFKPNQLEEIESRIQELLDLDDTKSFFSGSYIRLIQDKIDLSEYQINQIDRLSAV